MAYIFSVKLYTSSEKTLLVYDKLSAQDMPWVKRNPGGLSTRLVVHYNYKCSTRAAHNLVAEPSVMIHMYSSLCTTS